jgi:hypothetical protein
MATLQQAAGLHPFVSKLKIVDSAMFPELQEKNLTSQEWCEPVLTDDFNIYTVTISPLNVTDKTLSVTKLQRQDFHENYFTGVTATSLRESGGLVPISYTENMIGAGGDAVNFHPILTKTGNGVLLLMYNRVAGYTMRAYRLKGDNIGGHDINEIWDMNWDTAVSNLNPNLRGFFTNSTTVFMYNVPDQTTQVILRSFELATGVELNPRVLELDQVCSSCKLTMSISNENTFYITVRTGTQIRMASCLLTTGIISGYVQVTGVTTISPTDPQFISFSTSNGVEMSSLVYGYNNDPNNVLQITYIPNIVNTAGAVAGLETPFYYNVNKFQLFSEVANTSQTDMAVNVATNPNNANFFYIGYVAGTSQLRVVKVYRNLVTGTTYETHVPLVMWGTRLGAIGDLFAGNMALKPDTLGNIYVISIDTATNKINMWKIKEYIMDLGHTEGTVVAPVDTMTDMLNTMTNEYTILTAHQNVQLGGFPNINDVTIDTIVNDGTNISIAFNYINYDYLQLFPVVVNEIKKLVTDTFVTLYEDTGINIVNLDPTAPTLDGDSTSINVFLPTGTAKKPCVVKGTEVIVFKAGQKPVLVNVEKIQAGDFVVNHLGQPVRVLEHLRSTILAELHNAPYVVPRNFFGVNRPYKDLLISGDHGILVSYQTSRQMRVVYPDDIKALSKVLIGNQIEFHHLLLENHQTNFFLANGLEVDSYHPGVILRGRRQK